MLEEQIQECIGKFKQQLQLATMNLTAWEVKTTKLRIELDKAKSKLRTHQDRVAYITGALKICQTLLEEEQK